MDTRDTEIRSALHEKVLKRFHTKKDARVVNELGVVHGSQRIDIAVIHTTLHGYEIKSSKDDLDRLPNQIQAFTKCFERLTIVVAQSHLDEVLELTPTWVGVTLATKGSRGAIHFAVKRKSTQNPNLDTYLTAHFLWKREAIELLNQSGVPHRNLPRTKLYKLLDANLSQKKILWSVRHYLKSRENWRSDLKPIPNGAPPRLASM